MKWTFVILAGAMSLTGVASAQTAANPSSTESGRSYVEGVAQSAFGNVTSQSFGVEGGVTIIPKVVVFGEFGRVRDTASPDIGLAAQKIAGYVTEQQSAAVAYKVRQPAAFGVVGVKYVIPYDADIQPYVLAGFGIARYARDVSFTVGGADVTGPVGRCGVALGSDLTGSTTKPMMTAGGGVAWTVSGPLVVDFQFRYGRIFAEGQGINVSRAGVGIGVRF